MTLNGGPISHTSLYPRSQALFFCRVKRGKIQTLRTNLATLHKKKNGIHLGVRTCELFLCFEPFVLLGTIALTSLFYLFYIDREFYTLLTQGMIQKMTVGKTTGSLSKKIMI